MVLRERKINCQANDIKLSLSFGVPDCRAFMKMYADIVGDIQKDCPSSEHDVRYWLEHDGRAFLSWPTKWREQLSGWCFATAVRNKLLIPTAADPNRYYLADCLLVKRGRPPQKE